MEFFLFELEYRLILSRPNLLIVRDYFLFLLRIILETLVQQGCTNPDRIYIVQRHQIRVAPQYTTYFILTFRWREFLCVIYISVNFENIWYRLLAIELKVNVLVINRFLLNDICFLYPNKQSTFRLCISLFYTICFGWFYWLKAVSIAKIQMENCTEFDASILQQYFLSTFISF